MPAFPLIGYASRTGTRANLQVLEAFDWRLLLSPGDASRYGQRLPRWPSGRPAAYMLDNGAWSCHTRGRAFDADAFLRLVDRAGACADWIVLPDIVAGGPASLELSLSWVEKLAGYPCLLPVQDGMTPAMVDAVLPDGVGLFVGGTTNRPDGINWKEASLPAWGRLKDRRGCWLHVARVNSARRIHLCHVAGADSIDGSCLSRFSSKAPLIDGARRQRPPAVVAQRSLFTRSTMPTPHTLLLLSGGIDSSTLAYMAAQQGRPLTALFIDYGQPAAEQERTAAASWCDRNGVALVERYLPLSGMDTMNAPTGAPGPRVVAARNAALIGMAANIAVAFGCRSIWIGCTAADRTDYPDCRPNFITLTNAVYSTTYGLTVEAPLIHRTRREVTEMASAEGWDLSHAWSCYSPNARGEQCLECDSCTQLAGATTHGVNQ